MSFTLLDLPDLTGHTAVVTGANSGLGLETARALAGAGALVVMTARSRDRYDEAEAQILPTNRRAELRFVRLDLADLASVRDAAAEIAEVAERIDVLVNNAGVMMTPELRTVDGLELQLGTNHMGHFALTGLLLDRLLASDDARVVTVSSGAHHFGEMDFDDLFLERPGAYTPTAAYGRSKLANLLFALELQRRFEVAGVAARSVAAHPGYAATNLQHAGVSLPGGTAFHRVADVAMKVMNPVIAQSAADGALPQIHAAVSDVPGGTYWGPQGLREMRGPVGRAGIAATARNEADARRLWERSVEVTGVDYAALHATTPA